MVLVAVAWLGGPCAPAGGPSMRDAEASAFGPVVVWDPQSRLVVFEVGRQLVLDRLVLDRSPYIELPMPPRWRVTGDWFSIPPPQRETGGAGIAPASTGHLFGQWPVALAGRVAAPAVDSTSGPLRVDAVLSEQGFLVVGIEAPEAGQIVLLDADGRRLGAIELRPVDG